jgi:hypothetical protein
MPPRATYDRPTTQGRVGTNFDAHDHALSQWAGQGHPYDNDNTCDCGRNTSSNPDNAQIDPSLLQVSPLGERQGQRCINVDSEGARVDFGQRKRATCDTITASLIRASKRHREL